MSVLFDAHSHLDFADNSKEIAAESSGTIETICSTVVPSSYVSAKAKFEAFPNIHVGLGMHPWWVADGRIGEANIKRFEDLCIDAPIIGEIGLDYHGKRRESRLQQLEVLERILQAIDDCGNGRIIFLHAVKCYEDLFKLFEEMGTFHYNLCVFHWFQGTPDDFGHALANGCSFSINMRMLATDAGQVIANAVPTDKLLMETDDPPHEGMTYSFDMWQHELHNTAKSLAELRGVEESEIVDVTAANAFHLLRINDALYTASKLVQP